MRKWIFFLTLFLPIIYCFADGFHVTYIPCKYYSTTDNEIFDLIRRCDFEASYEGNGQLYISELKKSFKLDELVSFFNKQKKKDLIVITFHPFAHIEENNEAGRKIINNLNDYFTKREYKRIVLLQGMSNGVGLYSDMTNAK